MLEKADDPANPDWRVISARGTAKAKQGLYGEAIPFYERAMQAAPDQASILSNLGLAYTRLGEVADLRPGKSGNLQRTLTAGNYLLICN